MSLEQRQFSKCKQMPISNLVLLEVAQAPKIKLQKRKRGSFVNANHFSLEPEKQHHLTKTLSKGEHDYEGK